MCVICAELHKLLKLHWLVWADKRVVDWKAGVDNLAEQWMHLGSLINLSSFPTPLLASLFSLLWRTSSISPDLPLSNVTGFPLWERSFLLNLFFSKSPDISFFLESFDASLLLKNLSSPPWSTTPDTWFSPTKRKLGRIGEKIGETALVLKTGKEIRLKREKSILGTPPTIFPLYIWNIKCIFLRLTSTAVFETAF